MKFAKPILGLLVCFFLFGNWQSLKAQSDRSRVVATPPDVDGMFDEDDLEILDEEIEEPLTNVDNSQDFDNEPARITPIRPSRRFSRSSAVSRAKVASPKTELNFASSIPNPNEKLRMDFIQVDIEELVKYFAERLRKKFIYDPSILSGKITIVSPTEVTVAEAYQAFLSAMEIRGYVVFPSGAYLKIEKVADARKSPVPLYLKSTPNDDSYVTRIINLKYLNVSDVRPAVQDLISRSGGAITVHLPTNTLIISDYASNIRRVVRILNILDVEGFQEQLAVIPIEYASASDVAKKISEIFPTGNNNRRTTRRTSRSRRTRTTAASEQGVIQKVVSDDRTNSLIVLGSERGIEQVRRFVEEIDVPIDGGDGQIHVYPLQNVKAEDIAQTLASLTQGGSRSAPTRRTSTRTSSAQSSNTGSASANLFDGGVKVTADSRTNSLVIQASPRDFETLKGIIRKLDIRRRQVFIESVILETTIGGGSEWKNQVNSPIFRTNKLGSNDPDVGTPKSGGLLGIGSFNNSQELLGTLGGLVGTSALAGMALGFQSGARVKFSAPSPNGGAPVEYEVPLLSAILRLASTNSNLNVLSTPHILATANEEASISIGEDIPQISSSQESAGGDRIVSTQLIRVATELAITPQINAGDYLTLNIKQKVNQRGEEVAAGQFAINTREAATTAIVKDGQTIVIGGIMRDQTDHFISKVPFLGDIPILGWLFKSKRTQSRKVNLLLFLTPHIIQEDNDADEVLFKKIKERQNFLKEQGLSEKPGLPLGGLKPEYLEMLDEEYLQSLELEPRVSAKPSVNSNSVPSIEPKVAPAPVPKPPKRETSIIPVMPTPRSSPDDYMDEPNSLDIENDGDFNQAPQDLDSSSIENDLEDLPELDVELPALENNEPNSNE